MDIRALDHDVAAIALRGGALLVDPRPVDSYLASHILGSISVLWEAGVGFATRARDLLPIDAPLILLDDPSVPIEDAAQNLRGKGFAVRGTIPGLSGWDDQLVTTPVTTVEAAEKLFLLDVADPGALAPEDATRIPIERLRKRHPELPSGFTVGVLAGWGVRAASAIGILEASGHTNLVFVRTRPAGAEPPQAPREIFRVGGPG